LKDEIGSGIGENGEVKRWFPEWLIYYPEVPAQPEPTTHPSSIKIFPNNLNS
jgi:hypothetical protein